jgi:ABC-type glycerol-3-phosphate transport system substrate-binding protein
MPERCLPAGRAQEKSFSEESMKSKTGIGASLAVFIFVSVLSAGPVFAEKVRIDLLADFGAGSAESVTGLLKAYASFADVRLIAVGENGPSKIPLLERAGLDADIALVDFESLARLGPENYFEPLDSYFTGQDKFDRASIWPNAWNAVTFGGKTYGVPVHVTTDALVYDKQLFDSLGLQPPKTWDDFARLSEKIASEKKPDGTPARYGAFFREKLEAWLAIYESRGGRILDESGTKVMFDNDAAVDALTLLANLHRAGGPVPIAEPFGRSLELNSAPVRPLYDEDFDENLYKGGVSVPLPSDGRPFANMRGVALVIFKNSPPAQKKAAWKLIRVIAGENLQSVICNTSGWLTANRKLASKSTFKAEVDSRYPRLKAYYQALEYAEPFPAANGNGAEIRDILRLAVMSAVYGAATPKEAIKTAAERAADVLDGKPEAVAPDKPFVPLNTTEPLPRETAAPRETSSPFGILLSLALRYSPDELDKVCGLARDAGIRWNREEITWSIVEPERGKFVWARYDNAIRGGARNGIYMLGLLDYTNGWSSPYSPANGKQREDFANYVYNTVSRYKNYIKYWEIWNEENIGGFWWPSPNAKDYTALLKESYKAAKLADPTAQVLFGGTSGADLAWIDSVYKAGGGDYFDYAAFHPYNEISALDDERYVQNLSFIKLLMEEYGGVKPAWLTEVGWPTTRGGISLEDQAAAYAKMVAHSLASGYVARILPYDFRDDGDDPDYGEANFGIVRRDLSPKPAYRTYGFLASKLTNYISVRRDDPDESMIGYRFELPDGIFIVLWARKKGDGRTYKYTPRGPLTTYNITGVTEKEYAPMNTAELKITNIPTFIFEKKTD